MLRSHPAIDLFPVDFFIFLYCSTLFAIAFLCDLKYVSRMSVSDFKNVFKCTKRNSSSGRAFLLKRCNFRISDCNCRHLKSSLFLLLFLSSQWTSLLFRCSQTLMWKRSNNNSIIFASHTNVSQGLVPSGHDNLLLSLPQNILYHPILACEYIYI